MRQIFLIILSSLTLFINSSIVKAENTLVFSDSGKPILQAMELSLKSNSLSYLYALQSKKENLAYKEYKQLDSLKLKNPNTALFYAAVPGFVVHGAGHFYAGKPKTGVFLFSMELIGAGLLYWGGLSSGFGEQSENGNSDGTAQKFIGFVLFAGSWVADLVGAPHVVKKFNELVKKR